MLKKVLKLCRFFVPLCVPRPEPLLLKWVLAVAGLAEPEAMETDELILCTRLRLGLGFLSSHEV